MRRQIMVLAALVATSFLATAAAAAPDGKNRVISVENQSTQTIREFYASPVTATTWEKDMLGMLTLPAGQRVNANLDNGTTECYFDLKVVLANGKAIEQHRINICAASRWIIGDTTSSLE